MILNVNCCIRKIILTSNWFISVRFFKKILPTHSGEMTSSVEVWRPEDGDWSSATEMPEVSRSINCADTQGFGSGLILTGFGSNLSGQIVFAPGSGG